MKKITVDIDELNSELDVLLYQGGTPIHMETVSEEQEEEQQEEESSSTNEINSEIVGTWYLVRPTAKSLFVSKDVPKGKDENYRLDTSKSGYMRIFDSEGTVADDAFTSGDWSLKPEDFAMLDLPEVTDANSPLEIEITKSGKVYYYES